MNEYPLNDPQLQSLEARLAASAPAIPAAERQQLLYQCAFAAGQRASRRCLRAWQAAAAALGVLVALLSVPFSGDVPRPEDPDHAAGREPSPAAAGDLAHGPRMPRDPRPDTGAELVVARSQRPQPPQVELDAWQVRSSDQAALTEQLAQFSQLDPGLRSLAVGRLTRSLTQP
jgi:hypothetical protein